VPGTGNTWYISYNHTKIGTQTAYNFGNGTGGWCDSASRACDWATIRADGPDINPLGTVRYWGGTHKQVDKSRFAIQSLPVSRNRTSPSASEERSRSLSPPHDRESIRLSRHRMPPARLLWCCCSSLARRRHRAATIKERQAAARRYRTGLGK
jgi:hypothetical protein